MRACREGHAELGHQIEEPLQGNAAPQRVIDMAQRLEAQRRAPQIVPAPAEQIGEQPGMAVQVKHFGLRVRVLHPLRPQEIAEGTFAGPGGAKNQEVAQVTDMVDDPKQRVVLRMDIETTAPPGNGCRGLVPARRQSPPARHAPERASAGD